MRGIIAAAGYLPHHRLDTTEIGDVFAGKGGRGTRTVSSYDEDTTTMGVEAARSALTGIPDETIDALWFATPAPAYLEKTNATAIHAALRLDSTVGALDLGGATRSGIGALRTALTGRGTTLVVMSDQRTGLPTSADEATGGDGAAALLVGDDDAGPVIAEVLATAAGTDEFLDRWRLPGAARSRAWEPRFVENIYPDLVGPAWAQALDEAGLTAGDIDKVVVTGLHARAVSKAAKSLGVGEGAVITDLTGSIGNLGAAHPGLLLASMLDGEDVAPGQTLALVNLADGADVIIVRTTDAVAGRSSGSSVAAQVEAGAPVAYGQFLSWRGMVTVEPPNRPPPNRPSASAAHRREDWKFGFVGSRDRGSGMLHLPPARVSEEGGAVDDMVPVPMAGTGGTVVSFTVDKLVYSPSPPVVFAVVDFDGGGRVPLELTDVRPDEVAVGMRVEPTFRRLFTSDEIHNYFWKLRPQRSVGGS